MFIKWKQDLQGEANYYFLLDCIVGKVDCASRLSIPSSDLATSNKIEDKYWLQAIIFS